MKIACCYVLAVFCSCLGVSTNCGNGWTEHGDSCYFYSKGNENDPGSQDVIPYQDGELGASFFLGPLEEEQDYVAPYQDGELGSQPFLSVREEEQGNVVPYQDGTLGTMPFLGAHEREQEDLKKGKELFSDSHGALKSYEEAREDCFKRGGDLALVLSGEEAFISVITSGVNDGVWIRTPQANKELQEFEDNVKSNSSGGDSSHVINVFDSSPCTYFSPSDGTVANAKSCWELRTYLCQRTKDSRDKLDQRLKGNSRRKRSYHERLGFHQARIPTPPPWHPWQRYRPIYGYHNPDSRLPAGNQPGVLISGSGRYFPSRFSEPFSPWAEPRPKPTDQILGHFEFLKRHHKLMEDIKRKRMRDSLFSHLPVSHDTSHRLAMNLPSLSRTPPPFLVKKRNKFEVNISRPPRTTISSSKLPTTESLGTTVEGEVTVAVTTINPPQETKDTTIRNSEMSTPESLRTTVEDEVTVKVTTINPSPEAIGDTTAALAEDSLLDSKANATTEAIQIATPQKEFLCHEGWCFSKPSADDKKSFNHAQRQCSENGGILAVLDSPERKNILDGLLRDVQIPVWIGLTGNNSEGNTILSQLIVSTTDSPLRHFRTQGPFEENCMAFMSNFTGSVRDCKEELPYICQQRDEIRLRHGDGCLEGWEHVQERCYKVFAKPASWNASERYCTKFGGHLTSAASEGEEDVLRRLSQTSEVSEFFSAFWVGLQIESEGNYRWTDGTPVGYLSWAEGQPDYHRENEHCGSATRMGFQLEDSPCSASLPFICEAASGSMLINDQVIQKKPNSTCEDDPSWLLYDGHCYKIISSDDEEPKTWSESRQLCRDIGGELASVHSVEENYWLQSKVHSVKDNLLWLGGLSYLNSGYEWTDGTPYDFANWAKDEPNNNYDQEDCIAFYTRNFGYWNDQNCGHGQGRICKRPHGATLPPHTTTEPPEGHCPTGWVDAGSKCLKFDTELVTFDDARKKCKAMDPMAELASINSAKEQAYVTAALGELKTNLWLGLRYDHSFHWMDQSALSYTNWAKGEPSTRGWPGEDQDSEHCVSTHTYNQAGQWNNVQCQSLLGYICQIRPDPAIEASDHLPACNPPFENYVNYSGMCYRPSGDEVKTWKEAEMSCISEGGQLASAASRAENAWLWVLTQQFNLQDPWIGFNNLQDKDVFKWSNGWPTLYTKWGQGEPKVSLENHNCTAVGSEDGLWYVGDCQEERSFICKSNEGHLPTPDPPSEGHCPDLWLDFGGSFCYLLVTEASPWADASERCASEGSHLASIHTRAELDLITQASHEIREPMWIGLVQMKNGFGWSDGTGYDFVNWKDGEPNSGGEECAEIYPGIGLWNDAFCSNARPFICKRPKDDNGNYTRIGVPAERTYLPEGSTSHDRGIIVGVVVPILLVVIVTIIYFVHRYKQRPQPLGQGGEYGIDNVIYTVDHSSIDDENMFEIVLNPTTMESEADGENDDVSLSLNSDDDIGDPLD